MQNLTPINHLYADCIAVTPVNYNWSEGYTEKWEAHAVSDCPECHKVTDTAGICRTDSCPNCDGDPIAGEPPQPMMNYYYPLPDRRDSFSVSDACEAIKDLPLVLIEWLDSGEYALALSGGGMDLSWEICEAFMRLGELPPVHFRLPAMCGRGISKRDHWIMAGCRASINVYRKRLMSAIRDLRSVAEFAKKEADKRKRT